LDPQKHKDNDELKGKNKREYPGLIVKIREEGVTFRSYRNGDTIFLSPETSVQAQKVEKCMVAMVMV
jgi:tRNA-guanine family transglycosylase